MAAPALGRLAVCRRYMMTVSGGGGGGGGGGRRRGAELKSAMAFLNNSPDANAAWIYFSPFMKRLLMWLVLLVGVTSALAAMLVLLC